MLDTAKAEVPNLVAAGFPALAGPLQEHNERFERLRERYREAPLVGSGTFLWVLYHRGAMLALISTELYLSSIGS